jgi:hypothetical protein
VFAVAVLLAWQREFSSRLSSILEIDDVSTDANDGAGTTH